MPARKNGSPSPPNGAHVPPAWGKCILIMQRLNPRMKACLMFPLYNWSASGDEEGPLYETPEGVFVRSKDATCNMCSQYAIQKGDKR
jgi:hypothetical protein